MGDFTTTYYVPSSSGWASGNYKMRLEVKQTYTSSTNTSVLRIKPQFYGTAGATVNLLNGTVKTKVGSASAVTQWDFSERSGGGNPLYAAPMDTSWDYLAKSTTVVSPETRYLYVDVSVSHGDNGKASVELSVDSVYTTIDSTLPKFTGSHTMTLNGDARTYTLTVSSDAHSSVTVKKGNTVLPGGSTVTYGDTLTITANADEGYAVKTFQVNGSSKTSPYTHTVDGAVSVSVTSEAKGLAYIRRSGSWQAHQCYIYHSGAWVQYRPYIYKSGAWVPYG